MSHQRLGRDAPLGPLLAPRPDAEHLLDSLLDALLGAWFVVIVVPVRDGRLQESASESVSFCCFSAGYSFC